jgi:hypothetical protein
MLEAVDGAGYLTDGYIGMGFARNELMTPSVANDLIGKSDIEVREAIGDKFPKHIYHSIVCIAALIAYWEPDHWAVDAVCAPT